MNPLTADDLTYWKWCLGVVQDFLDGALPPLEAQITFQTAFSDRPGMKSEEEYAILNEIFLDFEDYTDDRYLEPGEVRQPGDLDLPELRRRMLVNGANLATLIARAEATTSPPDA